MGREPLLFLAVLIREIGVLVDFAGPVTAGERGEERLLEQGRM